MPPLERLPSSLSCAFHCDLGHQLWAVQQELEKVSELKPGLNLWSRKSSTINCLLCYHCFLEMFASGNFPFTALTSNAPAWHKAISGYLVPEPWLQMPFLGSPAVVGSGKIRCAQAQWVLVKQMADRG